MSTPTIGRCESCPAPIYRHGTGGPRRRYCEKCRGGRRRGRPVQLPKDTPRMPRVGATLTWREVAVLQQMAEGLTNDEIGAKLNYAPGTVSTMVHRIYRKLDAPNRAAAVNRGWQLDYLGRHYL